MRKLRHHAAAAVALGLVFCAAAVPAPARTDHATRAHRLIVTVRKNLPPTAEKKLAVLVLISQNGGAPAGTVATPARPATVLLANRGVYRVKAEINAVCRGTCSGSLRLSGSADHKLAVVPSCRLTTAGFVCSKVALVRIS